MVFRFFIYISQALTQRLPPCGGNEFPNEQEAIHSVDEEHHQQRGRELRHGKWVGCRPVQAANDLLTLLRQGHFIYVPYEKARNYLW